MQVAILIADEMQRFLTFNGISWGRRSQRSMDERSLSMSRTESRAFGSSAYVAIHTNANGGRARGIRVYVAPDSVSRILADNLLNSIDDLYQRTAPNASAGRPMVLSGVGVSGEVGNNAHAPAALTESGFHDNAIDSVWIVSNIRNIARAHAIGICYFFGITFQEPGSNSGGGGGFGGGGGGGGAWNGPWIMQH